jgi:hypothetical protein
MPTAPDPIYLLVPLLLRILPILGVFLILVLTPALVRFAIRAIKRRD